MHFQLKTALAVLTTMANLALPLPVEQNILNLAPSVVSVYLCGNANWQQPCEVQTGSPGLCMNIHGFLGEISSIGPDTNTGNAGCSFYSEYNCQGVKGFFAWPGIGNLGTYTPQDANGNALGAAGDWNDLFHSFICY